MPVRFSFVMLVLAAVLVSAWADTAQSLLNPRGAVVVPAVRNYAPRYSPDGKWIAFLRGTDLRTDTELWVMDARGKNAKVLFQQPNPAPTTLATLISVIGYVWSPDSKSLICRVIGNAGLSSGFYQVTLDGKVSPLPELGGAGLMIMSYAISPDRTTIAVFSPGQYVLSPLRLVALAPRPIPTPNLTCTEASWGIDGKIYCAMTPIAQLETVPSGIYAIEPDGKITPVITPPASERAPALSPDGKWLAYLRKETLAAREQATGKETAVLHGVIAYRWLSDGRLLAMTREVWPLEKQNDPFAAREIVESFVITRPGLTKPEFRALYRTTALPPVTQVPSPFYQSADSALDLTGTRTSLGGNAHLAATPMILPDISPDGKWLVYEWEKSLYLVPLAAGQALKTP